MTLSTIFKPTITIHSRKYKLLDQIGEGITAFSSKLALALERSDILHRLIACYSMYRRWLRFRVQSHEYQQG